MKTKRARYIRKRLFNMAFILPLLIVNITFFVIPFVKSLYMSLFDWKLLGNKLFIGLANYAKAFQDPKFLHSLKLSLHHCCLLLHLLWRYWLIRALKELEFSGQFTFCRLLFL